MSVPGLRAVAVRALDKAQAQLGAHGPSSPEFEQAIRLAAGAALSFWEQAGLELPPGQALISDARAEGLLLPALGGGRQAAQEAALDLCAAVPGVSVDVAAGLAACLASLVTDDALPAALRCKAATHFLPLSGVERHRGQPAGAVASTRISAGGRVVASLLPLVLAWGGEEGPGVAEVGGAEAEDALRARVLNLLFAFGLMPVAAAKQIYKGQMVSVGQEIMMALALSPFPAALVRLASGGAGPATAAAATEFAACAAAMSLRDVQPPLLALALAAQGGWEVSAALQATLAAEPEALGEAGEEAEAFCRSMRAAEASLRRWFEVNRARVAALRAAAPDLPHVSAGLRGAAGLGAAPDAASDPVLAALAGIKGQVQAVLGGPAGGMDALLPRLLDFEARAAEAPGCLACGAAAAERCGACRVGRYCSRACQRQDWREHKPLCVLWAAYVGTDSPEALAAVRTIDDGCPVPL